MAKRLQHRGGTTSQHSTFTGAVREVTVDTDKNTLVVHDGATAGGHPLATATNFTSTGIDDNATSTILTVQNDGLVSGTTATYNIGSSSNQWKDLWLKNGGRVYFADSGTAIYGSNSLDIFTFSLNSSERMRLTTTGLGIGTSSPEQKLDVNGIAQIKTQTSGTRKLRIKDSVTSEYFDIGVAISSSQPNLTFSDGASERMRINSSGQTLIGTTVAPLNADTKLMVHTPISTSSRNVIEMSHNTNGANKAGAALGLTINNGGEATNAASLLFYTASGGSLAQRMKITPTGNVGIGTSSPSQILNVKGSTGSAFVLAEDSTGVYKGKIGVDPTGGVQAFIVGSVSNHPAIFRTNNTERMRITSGGNLYVGGTSPANLTKVGVIGGSTTSRLLNLEVTHTTAFGVVGFMNGNGTVGSISMFSNSVGYNTSSDYRLKENVSYDFDATSRLKQLKPARFNFIADANTTVDGFLAHEVSNIVPEAITGEKDATETKEKVVLNANGNIIAENIEQADWETGKIADEEGNTQYPTDSTWEATKVVPVYQGIDQSKLVPLLVKTIQELEARITALETNNP